MKIGILNVTTFIKDGGPEVFVREIAKSLAKMGHEVTIFSGNGKVNFELIDGVEIVQFPYIPRDRFWNFGSRFRKFAERLSFAYYAWHDLRNRKFDWLYIHKPFDFAPALLYRYASGAKIAYSSHGTEFYPGYRALIAKMDAVASCSEYNAGEVEDYCGIRPKVIFNGVDLERFHPMPKDAIFAASLGIGEQEIVFFTACRLVGWKGVQIALQAMSKLKEQNWRYIVGGDGEYRGKLESLANELGIASKVSFLGRIENGVLPKYYALADFAIYPSIANETFGMTIAEAMACEVCVVATDVGGIPEVIDQPAQMAIARDAHSLRDKIEALLADRALANELARKGRKRVEELFTWDAVAKRLLSVLK